MDRAWCACLSRRLPDRGRGHDRVQPLHRQVRDGRRRAVGRNLGSDTSVPRGRNRRRCGDRGDARCCRSSTTTRNRRASDLLTGTPSSPRSGSCPASGLRAIQPEVVPTVTSDMYDDRAVEGTTVALTRDEAVVRRSRTSATRKSSTGSSTPTALAEASRRRADWAVLPLDAPAASPAGASSCGRRRGPSYRRAPGVSC